MTKVTMNIAIKFDGKQIAAGTEIPVADNVAQRWAARGIAKIGGGDLSTQDTSQSETPTSTSAKK